MWRTKERMRTVHVQRWLRGFLGFCPWCGRAVRESETPTGTWGPTVACSGCLKRLILLEREVDVVEVAVGDKVYRTEATGWKHVVVGREEVFYKRVGTNGDMARLSSMEAAQLGIAAVGSDEGPTTVPSAPTTTWTVARKYVERTPSTVASRPLRREATAPTRRIGAAGNVDEMISEAAKRLFAGKSEAKSKSNTSAADALRAKHIARFGSGRKS